MKQKTTKEIYQENIQKKAQLEKELEAIQSRLELAKKAFYDKIQEMRDSDLIPCGGYISTGFEDEEFTNGMAEFDAELEQKYAGTEKAALAEVKGEYLDKLLEYDEILNEINITKALMGTEESMQPGAENE